MSRFPDDLQYSPQHLWLRSGDGRYRVGLTDVRAEQLGVLVGCDLPLVGSEVQLGDQIGELIAPAERLAVIAPASGIISAANPAVADHPELVREDSYGEGWLFELQIPDGLEGQHLPLWDEQGYAAALDDEA